MLKENTSNKIYNRETIKIIQQYASSITIGRTGIPEDIAKVVAFLTSDDAEYLE